MKLEDKKELNYMEAELFKATVRGDVLILSKTSVVNHGDAYFLSRSPHENNIIHIATEHGHINFIDQALDLFPFLVHQKNKNGDTPLHIAARKGNTGTIKLLISVLDQIAAAAFTDATADFYLATNNEGDTVIHVALKGKNNMEEVRELLLGAISRSPQVLKTVNNSGETPLHHLVQYYSDPLGDYSDMFGLGEMYSNKFADIAMCLQDKDGFTPLLKAANNGDFFVVKRLLGHCPQSVEVCDFDCRNVVHILKTSLKFYKELKEFVVEPEITILINALDCKGNTPAHNAIENGDFIKFIVLSQAHADFTIKNKKGISVNDLIHKYSHQLCRAEIETEKTLLKVMNDMLFESAAFGKVEVVAQSDEEDLLSRTQEGSSIIHIALKNGHVTVVEELLKRCPILLFTRDLNGDTPLHIAARYGNLAAKTLVHYCNEHAAGVKKLLERKNLLRYTPLHEALRTGNIDIAVGYLNLNHDGWENFFKDDTEAPLHMLARYAPNSTNKLESITQLVSACEWAIFQRDSDGFTPLMRAAQCGNLLLAHVIIRKYCSCIELYDPKGRNFLHYLRLQLADSSSSKKDHLLLICKDLLTYPGVETLIYSRDNDGNTPIHLAIMDQDFDIAEILVKRHCDIAEPNTRKILISIRNNDGKSAADLLTSSLQGTSSLKKLMEQAFTERIIDEAFIKASRIGDDDLLRKRRSICANKEIQQEVNADDHHDTKKELQQPPNVSGGFDMNKDIQEISDFGHDIIGDIQEADANNEIQQAEDEIYYDDDYFLDQALDGSNILHIAVKEGHLIFMEKAVKLFPELMLQKDSNGDSPLHIAARHQTPASLKFLDLSCTLWDRDEGKLSLNPAPWMIKDSSGNTLMHEAARNNNYGVLSTVFKHYENMGPQVFEDVNDNGETLLHMVAKYATYPIPKGGADTVASLIASSNFAPYERDVDDLTPLLRAAHSGRLDIMNGVLYCHPQSLEVSDNKGRTILHHLRSSVVKHNVTDIVGPLDLWDVTFLNHPKVDKLRSARDKDGNTPLHLAIMRGDVAAAKFLIQKCVASENRQELSIFNNDGHSVYDLLSSQPNNDGDMKELKDFVTDDKRYVLKEMMRAVKVDDLMVEELHKAVKEGDASIFDDGQKRCSDSANVTTTEDVESGTHSKHEDAFFLTHTADGSNIIHLALKYSHSKTKEEAIAHIQFVNKALDRFPSLILESDYDGDTPLHLTAKFDCPVSWSLLKRMGKDINELFKKHGDGIFVYPYTKRNSKGNMPIHEAIQCNHLPAIEFFLEFDPETASYTNLLGETPLHLYAKYGFYFQHPDGSISNLVKSLVNLNKSLPYMRDNEGLTPLLTAAKSGGYHVVQRILQYCPQSAHLRDPTGKTFLHFWDFTSRTVTKSTGDFVFEWITAKLFEVPEVDTLRLAQDNDGNTPLHYAIKTKNFILAEELIKRCVETKLASEISILNNDGESIADLLEMHEVPIEVFKHLRKIDPHATYKSGRSSYGVHSSKAKESVNSLSVIAGLLATITFAAAFQVPGGFNSDNGGSPILLKKAAFQAFLVFDVVAMCGSMLSLFSLIWVMGCSKPQDSLILLDFSMLFLQGSFYATLAAFMTGVYATTAHEALWLAIFVCVTCSIVPLVSWRTFLSLTKFIILLTDMFISIKGFSIEKYKKHMEPFLGLDEDLLL